MADELTMYQDRIRKVRHEGEWWFSVVDVWLRYSPTAHLLGSTGAC
jgi:hypothetical protein